MNQINALILVLGVLIASAFANPCDTQTSGDWCWDTGYVSCPSHTTRACQAGLVCSQASAGIVYCVRPEEATTGTVSTTGTPPTPKPTPKPTPAPPSTTGSTSGGGAHCTGNPPMYNGLLCATTTYYDNTAQGACGCGTQDNVPFDWVNDLYTAAGNQMLYDQAATHGSWCGSGCGLCYRLTPSGDCVNGATSCATSTGSITVMIVDYCDVNEPNNAEWCPASGVANAHGTKYHFDLSNSVPFQSLGWSNPIVTFEQVSCGTGGSPSDSDYDECVCASS